MIWLSLLSVLCVAILVAIVQTSDFDDFEEDAPWAS